MGSGANPAYVVLLTTLRCNAARSYSFREHEARPAAQIFSQVRCHNRTLPLTKRFYKMRG